MNVAAGRIANRLDLGGTNYTVDAACASSLSAIGLGARELQVGHQRHGARGRRRRDPEPVRLPVLRQDAGAVAHRPLPPVRRRRRRDRDQRGVCDGRAQAPRRRRARRRPHLRRDPRRRGRQRRARPQPHRAPARGPDAGPAPGLRAGAGLPGDGRAGRGPRHRHGRRRRRRGEGAQHRLRRALRRAPVVRDRLGQVDDRPHQGDGGRGRPDQGGAGAAPPRAAAHDRGERAEPEGRLPRQPVLREHRGASVADGRRDRIRAAPGSARSASAGPTSTSCSRSTAAPILEEPDAPCPALAGRAAAVARHPRRADRRRSTRSRRGSTAASPRASTSLARELAGEARAQPRPDAAALALVVESARICARSSARGRELLAVGRHAGARARRASTSPSGRCARDGQVAFLFPGQGSQLVGHGTRAGASPFPRRASSSSSPTGCSPSCYERPLSSYIFPPPGVHPRGAAAPPGRADRHARRPGGARRDRARLRAACSRRSGSSPS